MQRRHGVYGRNAPGCVPWSRWCADVDDGDSTGSDTTERANDDGRRSLRTRGIYEANSKRQQSDAWPSLGEYHL